MNSEKQSVIPETILFFVLSAVAFYALMFLPVSRQFGLFFRNTLYVFPLIFITAFLCCRCNKWIIRAMLIAMLFAMSIAPFSGVLNSGLSDQYALSGIIPWSDAFTLQLNTQRFMYGGMMGQATAIRPISSVFYAAFLYLTGQNYLALYLFLIILTGLCLLAILRSADRLYGSACAAFAYTCLFFYIRKRYGTFMTEPYGFLSGLLSAYFFLNSIVRKRHGMMLMGCLMLSLSLNARPAAMFLFPFIGLWYFFVFAKGEKQRFLLSLSALCLMLIGFGINRYTQIFVYGTENISNRQAAEMIYGLCRGGESWGDVVATEEMAKIGQSEQMLKDLAGLCAPIIREHPENLFLALKAIFFDSLIRSEYYGAFSFINGNPEKLNTPIRYALLLIWTAGFILTLQKRKELSYSFLLYCEIGVLLSMCAAVPFSTNYMRLYASSIWVPCLTVGLLPEWLSKRFFKKHEAENYNEEKFISVASAIFILTALLAPKLIAAHPLEKPLINNSFCASDEDTLITTIDRGSFVYLKNKEDLETEHYPYFRLPYVRQHFHDTASLEMFPFTDAIEEPTAIIRGIDLTNNMDALIFAPLNLVEGKTGTVQFCGKFLDPPILRNDRFFIPTSAHFSKEQQ